MSQTPTEKPSEFLDLAAKVLPTNATKPQIEAAWLMFKALRSEKSALETRIDGYLLRQESGRDAELEGVRDQLAEMNKLRSERDKARHEVESLGLAIRQFEADIATLKTELEIEQRRNLPR